MIRIYHNDGKLILIRKFSTFGPGNIGLHIEGGMKTIYEAHEIWIYNPNTKCFENYKNKYGHLLENFLKSKDINIKCCVANIRTVKALIYQFKNNKDEFLFNLKFGA